MTQVTRSPIFQAHFSTYSARAICLFLNIVACKQTLFLFTPPPPPPLAIYTNKVHVTALHRFMATLPVMSSYTLKLPSKWLSLLRNSSARVAKPDYKLDLGNCQFLRIRHPRKRNKIYDPHRVFHHQLMSYQPKRPQTALRYERHLRHHPRYPPPRTRSMFVMKAMELSWSVTNHVARENTIHSYAHIMKKRNYRLSIITSQENIQTRYKIQTQVLTCL